METARARKAWAVFAFGQQVLQGATAARDPKRGRNKARW